MTLTASGSPRHERRDPCRVVITVEVSDDRVQLRESRPDLLHPEPAPAARPLWPPLHCLAVGTRRRGLAS